MQRIVELKEHGYADKDSYGYAPEDNAYAIGQLQPRSRSRGRHHREHHLPELGRRGRRRPALRRWSRALREQDLREEHEGVREPRRSRSREALQLHQEPRRRSDGKLQEGLIGPYRLQLQGDDMSFWRSEAPIESTKNSAPTHCESGIFD